MHKIATDKNVIINYCKDSLDVVKITTSMLQIET